MGYAYTKRYSRTRRISSRGSLQSWVFTIAEWCNEYLCTFVKFRSRKRSRIAAPLCAAKFGIRIRNERSFALYPDKMKKCFTESEKKKKDANVLRVIGSKKDRMPSPDELKENWHDCLIEEKPDNRFYLVVVRDEPSGGVTSSLSENQRTGGVAALDPGAYISNRVRQKWRTGSYWSWRYEQCTLLFAYIGQIEVRNG